jgi:hypothetical protein
LAIHRYGNCLRGLVNAAPNSFADGEIGMPVIVIRNARRHRDDYQCNKLRR